MIGALISVALLILAVRIGVTGLAGNWEPGTIVAAVLLLIAAVASYRRGR